MPNNHDLQPLLDTQQNQLNLVFSDSNGIDAKALAVLGANIAVLLFIDAAALHLASWQTLPLVLPFVASLILTVLSIWPRDYLGAAANLDKSPEYLAMDKETLLLTLLADTQAAIDHNTIINEKRLRLCSGSIAFISLGFLMLLLIL